MTRNAAVIPAKGGIWVLNGSRVLCAVATGVVSPAATHTCGWLTHGRFLFFARAKKRNQKKARPGAADSFLRFSPARALANSSAA